jgi:hypothetical protein
VNDDKCSLEEFKAAGQEAYKSVDDYIAAGALDLVEPGLTMPEWWDPKWPAQELQKGVLYRGKDGRWYDCGGATHSRAERRRGGQRRKGRR